MSFTDKVRAPFKSNRVREVKPPDEPSPFAAYGGWGEASDAASGKGDPDESERTARVSAAVALTDLEAKRDAERMAALNPVRRAAIEAKLAEVGR